LEINQQTESEIILKLKAERDKAWAYASEAYQREIDAAEWDQISGMLHAMKAVNDWLVTGITAELKKNAHLADGEDCPLIDLKRLL